MISRPLSITLFPYTTLFRSASDAAILDGRPNADDGVLPQQLFGATGAERIVQHELEEIEPNHVEDRKSTRLNSSHGYTSYAVFSMKKKTHAPLTAPLIMIRC